MRLILLTMLCTWSLTASASGSTGWQSLSFDGHGFVAGAGSGAIMVRDGYLPQPAGAAVHREDRLPKATGAIAILCYQQVSGGKLQAHAAVIPMEAMTVTVSRRSLTVAGRTDASGYLVLALPPGTYDVTVLGFSKRVVVESDKTALAAFRGGKRAVD